MCNEIKVETLNSKSIYSIFAKTAGIKKTIKDLERDVGEIDENDDILIE